MNRPEPGEKRPWRRAKKALVWLLGAALAVFVLSRVALALIMVAWRASEERPRTYAVALGDLDGDGDLDAFYGNGKHEGFQPNAVLFNQGGRSGDFQDSSQRLRKVKSDTVQLADLDGDGDLDAIAAGLPGYGFFYNDGRGQFEKGDIWSLKIMGAWSLAPGDLDGDRDLDLLVANCCARADALSNYVLFNAGGAQGGAAGVFPEEGSKIESQGTQDAALGDLDGDGDLDAFLGNSFIVSLDEEIHSGQPNTVWWNDGAGHLADSGQRLGQAQTRHVALGDLDGDGDLDVYAANVGPDEVWLNEGARPGLFVDSGQRLGDEQALWLELADLDGDGDLDAAVLGIENSFRWFPGGHNRLFLWMNDGLGRFSASRERVTHSRASAFDLGDLDGDGDLDIFAGWFENRYTIWWNRGDGAFEKR